MRSISLLPIILVLLFPSIATSATSAAQAPRVTVILADHLTLADLTQTPGLHNLAGLSVAGEVALVSPGSPRPPDPAANAYATLTAGDVANTRNPHQGLLQRSLAVAGASDRVQLISFGDVRAPGRLQALDALVGAQLRRQHEGIFALVGVVPPQGNHGGWDRLTPIVVQRNLAQIDWLGVQPWDSTLTSDTTHTPGLIALRDVAPTILSLAQAPIPASMTGAPAEELLVPNRVGLLHHLDTLTVLNQHILLPLAWFLGLFGGAALFGTICVLAGRKRVWPAGLRYLLRLVIAFPLAVLVAPLFNPQTLPVYALAIVCLDLALAFIPSAGALCALTAGVIVIDGFAGSPLVAQAALSGYWLPGIRFYGIGNEYMGVLLGTALIAPFLLNDLPPPLSPSPLQVEGERLRRNVDSSPPSWREGGWGVRFLLALWFALVTFVLSFPAFGAKAGGAITALVCFAPAWCAVALGKRIGWLSFVLSALAGVVLVFAVAALGSALGLRPTHIQTATAAVAAGKLTYIAPIALRKAKMAVRIFLHPGVLLTLAGLLVTYAIWKKSRLPEEMAAFLSRRPSYARALNAGGWGILAALLFNDSGTVAAFFLFGVLAMTLLHETLAEAKAPEDGQPALAAVTECP